MKANIYHIFLILAVWLMAGCSSAEPQATEPDAEPILMGARGSASFEPLRFSRAGNPDVPGEMPETVGLYGEMQGYLYDIFANQIVYNKNGKKYAEAEVQATLSAALPEGYLWPPTNDWVYAPIKYWAGGKKYQFYCYAPHSSIEGTTPKLTSNSYGAMTKFELQGIPPYSSYDYMVAAGYKKWQGSTVPFDMLHISARIRLCIKIGEQYSQMRRIKITRVTVNDRAQGGSYHNCVVTLNDDPAYNTITTEHGNPYQPSTDQPEVFIIPIFEDPTGLTLDPDEYQEFGSLYVMPQDITSLTINVTYDVYDHENAEPIRPAQRVTNTVTFQNANGDNYITTESGKYYDINIVVSPKYLYVLSDNDIKPDILISPED